MPYFLWNCPMSSFPPCHSSDRQPVPCQAWMVGSSNGHPRGQEASSRSWQNRTMDEQSRCAMSEWCGLGQMDSSGPWAPPQVDGGSTAGWNPSDTSRLWVTLPCGGSLPLKRQETAWRLMPSTDSGDPKPFPHPGGLTNPQGWVRLNLGAEELPRTCAGWGLGRCCCLWHPGTPPCCLPGPLFLPACFWTVLAFSLLSALSGSSGDERKKITFLPVRGLFFQGAATQAH